MSETPSTSVLPRAVLWDLDGTLMDTEELWFAQERALVEEYGGVWTDDDAMELVGLPLLESAARIKAHSPVTLDVQAIVDRMQGGVVDAMRREVPWRAGIVDLLTELRQAGVPQALVTMSWRPVLEIVLGHLPEDTFQVLITGDMVTRGKPHPEPYLRALTEMGVRQEEICRCVAVEDSVVGSASAVNAGIPTLVVPCVMPVPPGPGLVLLDTLGGVSAADLPRLAAPALQD